MTIQESGHGHKPGECENVVARAAPFEAEDILGEFSARVWVSDRSWREFLHPATAMSQVSDARAMLCCGLFANPFAILISIVCPGQVRIQFSLSSPST